MLELFADQPGLFTAFALVLGLLVGSFLNVVIHRVPRMLEREWREQCAWLGENAEALPAVPAPPHEDGARSRTEALGELADALQLFGQLVLAKNFDIELKELSVIVQRATDSTGTQGHLVIQEFSKLFG